jgi:hypothetical protein
MFPRDMVCLRNISVDTLHKGDTDDDDDDDDDNNNNNNNNVAYADFVFSGYVIFAIYLSRPLSRVQAVSSVFYS